MGFEHSSGVGTGRSLRSTTTTITSSPMVDGTGHANNHHLMHFDPVGSLFLFFKAEASSRNEDILVLLGFFFFFFFFFLVGEGREMRHAP